MKRCIQCALYHQGFCRLIYRDPTDGERITNPLSAYEARSYQWACGSGGSFYSSIPAPLYEKLLGTFSVDEIDHQPYPHEE